MTDPMMLYWLSLSVYVALTLAAFTLALFYRFAARTTGQKDSGSAGVLISLLCLLYALPAYLYPLSEEYVVRAVGQRAILLGIPAVLVWVGCKRARREWRRRKEPEE